MLIVRHVPVCLAALIAAACDSGFDPLPPVDPEVHISVQVDAPERAIPGLVTINGSCVVTLGGLSDQSERMAILIDGEEIASVQAATIETETLLSDVGAHTVSVECRFEDESERVERTVDVIEPAWVTVHLRNFTQDGEPFVRGDGPITFTVGATEVTTEDSAVVPVLPGLEYPILAEHPDFLRFWARIQDHETGELLQFYQIRDQNSLVRVESSLALDVFKLGVPDITAGPPRYTVDQLRTLFYGDNRPYTGKLHRFVSDTIGVYAPVEVLDRLPSVQRAIDKLFLGDGPYHISKLTNGVVRHARVSSEPFERDSPVIFVSLFIGPHAFSHHNELADLDGVLQQSSITLAPGAGDRPAVAYFLHALGLSGSINGVNDMVDPSANPSRFSKLALKILYASEPGTRF